VGQFWNLARWIVAAGMQQWLMPNFWRVHQTLRVTPAMEAGVATHVPENGMRNHPLRTVVSLLALIVAAQGVSATQDSPENLILARAVATSRRVEPEWRFTRSILNAPGPLMDEQLGVAGGSWEWLSDSSTLVGVTVYTIATAEAATRWLYRQAHGEVAKGWTVVTYEAGDGANMSTYPDPRGFTQYETTIRKGRFLVTVSGRSQETIERFAKILVTAISNWPTTEKHTAAVALHFMHYNFCRVRQTLRVTPATEAGIASHVWSLEEIVGPLDAVEKKPRSSRVISSKVG
jgi:hypothetical protein